MKTDVVTVTPDHTLRQAAALMVEEHIGTLPVIDHNHRLVGLLTLVDLLNLFMPDFVKLLEQIDFVRDFGALEEAMLKPEDAGRPVRALMRKPVSLVRTGGLLHAFAEIERHDYIRDLPVVDEHGVLVGIASQTDIGTAFLGRWLARPNARTR